MLVQDLGTDVLCQMVSEQLPWNDCVREMTSEPFQLILDHVVQPAGMMSWSGIACIEMDTASGLWCVRVHMLIKPSVFGQQLIQHRYKMVTAGLAAYSGKKLYLKGARSSPGDSHVSSGNPWVGSQYAVPFES